MIWDALYYRTCDTGCVILSRVWNGAGYLITRVIWGGVCYLITRTIRCAVLSHVRYGLSSCYTCGTVCCLITRVICVLCYHTCDSCVILYHSEIRGVILSHV